MAFYRIYPSKDTSIASGDPSVGTKDITGSNVGAAEILNLYRTVDEFRTQANILVQFDITQIPAIALASGALYQLRMFDAQHCDTIPTEFNAIIYQATRNWSEGAGHDMDYYTDLGWANWVSSSATSSWAVTGGDNRTDIDPMLDIGLPIPFDTSITSSAYFYTGHEDLDADVHRAVFNWLSNGNNYGFFIQIDPALTATDYYIKKFHSRQTHFPTRRPYLEVRWSDGSGTLSSRTIYTVVSGDYSGTVWPSSSAWAPYLSSGTMVTSTAYSSVVDPTGVLTSNIPSLKAVYDASEVVELELQSQLKDWSPATAHTASSGTPNVVLTKVYYRVTDVITDEVLVPFTTGSVIEYTRLRYDDSGSYFKFYMNSVPTGSLLQFDFLYEAPTGSGNWTLIPGTANRFRVISNG